MGTSNTFGSMKANFKEEYDKKKRFKRVKTLIQPKGKATAALDASKDPMKALKDKSYLNLKGKKGVAV